MSTLTKSDYRIYVACLAAYNNGFLHGRWIDCTQGVDYINEEVQAMLAESPEDDAEEWAIHDYDLGGVRIDEWESFDRCADIGALLDDDRYPIEVIAHLIGESDGDDISKIVQRLDDCYAGEYADAGEYARELTEECENVPEYLKYYIDYDKMAGDMELNGEITMIENGYKSVFILMGN